MPLLRFDTTAGRGEKSIGKLCTAVRDAVLALPCHGENQ